MTERSPRLLPVGSLSMLPVRGTLEERVIALLDEYRDLSLNWPSLRRWVLTAALVSFTLVIGLVRVTSRSELSAAEEIATAAPAATEGGELGTGRITGRVVNDQDGKAVVGAAVILLPPPRVRIPTTAPYLCVRPRRIPRDDSTSISFPLAGIGYGPIRAQKRRAGRPGKGSSSCSTTRGAT